MRNSFSRVAQAPRRWLSQTTKRFNHHQAILGVNYTKQLETLNALKRQSQRPLTLTEKLLYSHLIAGDKEWDLETIECGKTILELRLDRIACYDVTVTMALL